MGLINTLLQANANRRNRNAQKDINQANVDMQLEINQRNLENQWEMWHATNEYNHPAAQMARYAEAGLNPHLIYGQSNTTSPVDVGNADAPVQYPYQQNPVTFSTANDFLDSLLKLENLRGIQINNDFNDRTLEDRINAIKLNNDLVKSQTNKVDVEVEKLGLEKTSISINNDIQSFYRDEIQPLIKEIESSKSDLLSNDVAMIPFKNRILEANTKVAEFEIQLDHMDYLLANSQLDKDSAELKKIQSEINKATEEINKIKSETSKNYTQMEAMGFNMAGQFLGSALDAFGTYRTSNALDVNLRIPGLKRKGRKRKIK